VTQKINQKELKRVMFGGFIKVYRQFKELLKK